MHTPTPMTDEELLKAIRTEVERAGEQQDDRDTNRTEAADYFYARLPAAPAGEENADRSTIVSTDVGDAVEAVLAEIVPAFSGQAPVEFVPFGPEDEAQSDIETRAVNYVAASAGAFMALNAAVKDALLRRAGVLKVFWEKKATVEYESRSGLDPQLLPELLQEGDGQAVEIVSAEFGDDGTVNGTIRRYTRTSKPRIEAVPLDEFLIDGNVGKPVADEARFLGHRRPMMRTELVQLGFDPNVVYALEPYRGNDSASTSARARAGSDTDYETGHESTTFVMVVEAYYTVDRDGDGIAELLRAVTAGGAEGTDELLLAEPWDTQPFCVGVPYLGLYSWDGISLFDKLRSVQDGKTGLLRNLLDASERNVRQRIGAVDRQVNMDDLLTSVMGGVVRMKEAGAVVPLPNVEIPPQLINVLNYLDEVRRDKGGGAIDTAAQAQALAGDTAHGLERMMSAAEQVNAMVAKNLAETMLKPLYAKLHALLRKYWQGPVSMRAAGQWQQAMPSQWQPRDELVVSMGMSVGERTRRTAALQAVMAAQTAALQQGQRGVLVDLPQVYAALIDIGRMSGLPAPEQYWINPASPEAQQAAAQAAQAAQQQTAMQAQAMQAQLQVPIQMEQIKAQAVLQKEQMQVQLDAMTAALKHMEAMFAQRVKLVDVETKVDAQDAAAEIDLMQLTSPPVQPVLPGMQPAPPMQPGMPAPGGLQ
jgi:hypothetical protein